MSKCLTTGQMVEQPKVGQIAETEEGYRVIKNKNGSITYLNKEPKYGQYLSMDLITHRLEWWILPNYVSFEKALEAYKQGKTITCFYGNDFDGSPFVEDFSLKKNETAGDLSMEMIIKGKWTIEGE